MTEYLQEFYCINTVFEYVAVLFPDSVPKYSWHRIPQKPFQKPPVHPPMASLKALTSPESPKRPGKLALGILGGPCRLITAGSSSQMNQVPIEMKRCRSWMVVLLQRTSNPTQPKFGSPSMATPAPKGHTSPHNPQTEPLTLNT